MQGVCKFTSMCDNWMERQVQSWTDMSERSLIISLATELSYLFRRNFLKHKSVSSYIVERHLAEQSVHQLVHVPGSRLQVGLFYQHLSGFLQTALQHITYHLHRPQTKCLMSGISHSQIKNDWYLCWLLKENISIWNQQVHMKVWCEGMCAALTTSQ